MEEEKSVEPSPPERGSGTALASLILSLLGVFLPLTAVVGLVLGIIEIKRINRGESPEAGHSMAVGGVILGALVIAVIVIILIVAFATGRYTMEF